MPMRVTTSFKWNAGGLCIHFAPGFTALVLLDMLVPMVSYCQTRKLNCHADK